MHFKGTEKAMLRLPHTAGIIVILKIIIFENKKYTFIGKISNVFLISNPLIPFSNLIVKPSRRSFLILVTVA